MPATTGNDTILAGALFTDIDGLSGNDLLVLRYDQTTEYNGRPFHGVMLDLTQSTDHLIVKTGVDSYHYNGMEAVLLDVVNIEAVDLTGVGHGSLYVVTADGNDTIRSGQGFDSFVSASVGRGANAVFAFGGRDYILTVADQLQDSLYGGAANDAIQGVGFNDIADGGDGFDTLQMANTALAPGFVGHFSQVISNPNWTNFEAFRPTLTSGNDVVYYGYDPSETAIMTGLDGGAGFDKLYFKGGESSIRLVTSGAAPDNLDVFFDGIDAFDQGYDDVPAIILTNIEALSVIGSTDSDYVGAGAGNDSLFGGDGNDALVTGRGADLAIGGAGNDWFSWVGSNDTLYGGAGLDSVELDLRNATGGVRIGDPQAPGSIRGIEGVSGDLTPYDDYVRASFIFAPIYGGKGYDTLIIDFSKPSIRDFQSQSFSLEYPGSLGDGQHSSSPFNYSGWEAFGLIGSSKDNDFLTGNRNDTLWGNGGNDILTSSGGRDLIYGGAGDDTIRTSDRRLAPDTLYGGAGDDSFLEVNFNTHVYGGLGFDVADLDYQRANHGIRFSLNDFRFLHGVEYVNSIYLTPYDDTVRVTFGGTSVGSFYLDGNSGNDLLVADFSQIDSRLIFSGYGVNDLRLEIYDTQAPVGRYYNNFERVHITGGSANDKLLSAVGDSRLYGGGGDDSLKARDGRDRLAGGDGDDWLVAGAGHDILAGDAGSDLLIGEAGNDTLTGGAGADYFGFSGIEGSGADVVTDFDYAEDFLLFGGDLVSRDLRFTPTGTDMVVSWDSGSVTVIGAYNTSITYYLLDELPRIY